MTDTNITKAKILGWPKGSFGQPDITLLPTF